jgi:hypothetical protein
MRSWLTAICLAISLFTLGCKTKPVPPEVKQAETQEHSLWRAGASLYAAEEYARYLSSYREAKDKLIRENAKFAWFRKYEAVEAAFKNLLDEGDKILGKVQKQKEIKSSNILNQIDALKKRISSVQRLSLMISEGRLARISLMRAELKLKEGGLLHKRENFDAAELTLSEAALHLKNAEDTIFSILERYNDSRHIAMWKKWAADTLSESRKKGSTAIIVNKIERKLTVYKNGKSYITCEVGLARNGLADKLHSGDYATPEGKYQIIKKMPASKYHKALLINYPNEEDRRQFNLAKKRGMVPQGVSIGGLIEIHGGGKDSLTDGCISLENKDMDRVFNAVNIGTPVTIVGALNHTNETS